MKLSFIIQLTYKKVDNELKKFQLQGRHQGAQLLILIKIRCNFNSNKI